MAGLDRRTAILGGMVAGSVFGLPSALRAADLPGRIIIVDRRFAASKAIAGSRAASGALVIDPRETDLGLVWREHLAVPLEHRESVVEGITLWSDLVICETFAREHGLRLASAPRQLGAGQPSGLQHWILARPRQAQGWAGAGARLASRSKAAENSSRV